MPTPETFLAALRDSFIGAEQVYTQGSCIMLYRLLKTVWPDAKPYWNEEARHMITLIGKKFYDIRGRVHDVSNYEFSPVPRTKVSTAIALPKRKLAWHRFAQTEMI